jgi:ABC-2 type transport system permease protein
MTADHSYGSETTVVHDSSGSVAWTRQVKSFARRSLKELFRSKVAFFWSIGWPVMWYALTLVFFIEVPESVPASEQAEVMARIKATNAISFGLFGAFTVSLVTFAKNFGSDLNEKRYRKFRSLPIAPSADLTGRFLAGFVMATLSYLTVLVVGALDGGSFGLRSALSIPVVAVSLLLFCVVGMSLAVIISTVVNKGEYVTAITNSVLIVLFFLTGFNGVTPSMVPESSQWLVNFAPNSLAARLQIYYLTDFDVSESGLTPPELPTDPKHLAVLVGFAVAFWLASVAIVRYRVYRGEAGE